MRLRHELDLHPPQPFGVGHQLDPDHLAVPDREAEDHPRPAAGGQTAPGAPSISASCAACASAGELLGHRLRTVKLRGQPAGPRGHPPGRLVGP